MDVKDAVAIVSKDFATNLPVNSVSYVEEGTRWFRNPLVALVIGGAVGATAGTLITARVLKVKYATLADEEIASVKARYKVGPEHDLEVMAQRYQEMPEAEGYGVVETSPADVRQAAESIANSRREPVQDAFEVARQNLREQTVFGGELADFDMTAELERREEHPDEPYIITKDEFEADEYEFEQSNLTYYEGDQTLADGRDEAIPNVSFVIGDDNLKFGYGSEDRNLVYVRNPKLKMEWEIIHSDGKFSVEVLGMDDEDAIQHSDRRRHSRHRSSD